MSEQLLGLLFSCWIPCWALGVLLKSWLPLNEHLEQGPLRNRRLCQKLQEWAQASSAPGGSNPDSSSRTTSLALTKDNATLTTAENAEALAGKRKCKRST